MAFRRFLRSVAVIALASTPLLAACTASNATPTTPTTSTTACSFTVVPDPATKSLGAGGGTFAVTVATTAGCSWTATSNADFLKITGTPTGTGPGELQIGVTANAGQQRTGTLTIADATVTVTQLAAGCAFTLSAPSASVPADGGTVPVAVTMEQGVNCSWTAAASDSFVTIASGASGTGSGSVVLAIARNSGGARTGTVTIAGQLFAVSQAAAPTTTPSCGFSINPGSVTTGQILIDLTVAVSGPSGCSWTATSNNPTWIHVKAGASGSGSGTVVFTVDDNIGPERTGSLSIAGQPFTVLQRAGSCAIGLSASDVSVNAGVTHGAVTVSPLPLVCTWTARSNDPTWLHITSGASGTGIATFNYTVDANNGAARVGTIAVNDQTIAVRQSAVPQPHLTIASAGVVTTIGPDCQGPGLPCYVIKYEGTGFTPTEVVDVIVTASPGGGPLTGHTVADVAGRITWTYSVAGYTSPRGTVLTLRAVDTVTGISSNTTTISY